MKKIILLTLILAVGYVLHAQVEKTITQSSPGTLTADLTAVEKETITDLTLSGYIDARDFNCLRDEMTSLVDIDMSHANIRAYLGSPAGEIPQLAFDNCSGLKSVTIPNSVTSIGDRAFSGCSGFNGTLTISNSFTVINDGTFSDCENLTGTVSVPPLVTSIGSGAFYNCSAITELEIDNKVTTIGSLAFNGCKLLEKVTVANSVPPTIYVITFTGVDTESCSLTVPTGSQLNYQLDGNWSLFININEADLTNMRALTVKYNEGGMVLESGSVVSNNGHVIVAEGGSVVFELVPDNGYHIATGTYGGVDISGDIVDNNYITPAVMQNKILELTFEKIQYTLSVKSADNGVVNLLCAYGEMPSFSFTPATNWEIYSLRYNETDVSNDLINGIYSVPAITENSLLSVVYTLATETAFKSTSTIKVYSNSYGLVVEGLEHPELVSIYDLSGKLIYSAVSKQQRVVIPLEETAVYILKVADRTYKVLY